MRGVDGRRGHMGQGRRRRARLMMIVMMMNAHREESISAPVDDRRQWRGWHASSAAQNRGACRAAAGHGAAGHGYGWKTVLDDYASSLLCTSARLNREPRADVGEQSTVVTPRTEERISFYAA